MYILFSADSPINYSYGFQIQHPNGCWVLVYFNFHSLIIVLTVVLWINISVFFNPDYLGPVSTW
jgi:hypothetical protein